MTKVLNYFKEVQAELSKVVWPTREQTIRYTILVIIVAIGTGLLLGGLDYLLTLLTDYLLDRFAGSI
jgi:preprotein translocase subunit SecE